ncbi:undecaprenyl-diphosphate phosphatase [Streptomyces sp. NPDC058877]|uniref:undecaprenyl-diphosphate phosphatase n=1 Tax=unclassified Streptomyces TaxID=2593676 RepID=UPI003699D112
MSVISVGQAVLLGVVEGVTEFLPISSTGHLKITEGLMGIPVDDASVVAFTAVIQVGAIAAVLVYFFKDIVRIVSAWGRGLVNKEERYHHDYKFAWWVIYATLPIVAVGLAAKPLIDGPLASLWVVAGSLIVGTAVSFAVAYASISWLLKFVAKHSFNAFVTYRIAVGVLLLGLLGTGTLHA